MKRGRLVLVKQDDETTLFECPDCGQRGSVPTPVLQKALSETDDVRISCTNCPSKFSPLAAYSASDDESDDASDNESDNAGDDDDAIIDALKANWQAADASPSAKTETPRASEAENDGALPAWLRPPEKKSEPTKSATTEPQEEIFEDEAPSQARDDTGDDVTANSEPNPIAQADATAQADPVEQIEDKPLEIDDTTASAFASPSSAPQTSPSPVPPAPANIEQAIERPATPDAPGTPTQWDNSDEDDFDEEDLEDGDIYRQPVDLLNAVQLILLTIVALLFAFSGFILLTSI